MISSFDSNQKIITHTGQFNIIRIDVSKLQDVGLGCGAGRPGLDDGIVPVTTSIDVSIATPGISIIADQNVVALAADIDVVAHSPG
jgi:hypothetical protein